MWRASCPQLMFVSGRGLLAIRVQGVVSTRTKRQPFPRTGRHDLITGTERKSEICEWGNP